jgi:hypothetical protein
VAIPSYQGWSQYILPEIRRWWPGEGHLWEVKSIDSYPVIIIHNPSGENRVYTRSCQDGSVADKIRGMTVHILWLDEVASWMGGDGKLAYDLLIGCRRQQIPGHMCQTLITTTPRWGWLQDTLGVQALPPEAWTTGIYTRGTTPSTRTYITTARSAANLSQGIEYEDSMRRQYSALFAEQEIDGQFVPPQTAVYPDFHPEVAVISAEIAEKIKKVCKRVVVGVDWGYATAAAVEVAIRSDHTCIITREYYDETRQITEGHMADLINRWHRETPHTAVYVPPERPESIDKFRGRYPQECQAVAGTCVANNQVEGGIDTIASLMRLDNKITHLASPALPGTYFYVSSNCPKTLKYLKEYRRKVDNKGMIVGGFSKNDHLPDAIRYAIHTELRGNLLRSY